MGASQGTTILTVENEEEDLRLNSKLQTSLDMFEKRKLKTISPLSIRLQKNLSLLRSEYSYMCRKKDSMVNTLKLKLTHTQSRLNLLQKDLLVRTTIPKKNTENKHLQNNNHNHNHNNNNNNDRQQCCCSCHELKRELKILKSQNAFLQRKISKYYYM